MSFIQRLILLMFISVFLFSCKKNIESDNQTDLSLGVNNRTVLKIMHEMTLLLNRADFVLLDWKNAKITYGSDGGEYTERVVPNVKDNLSELIYVITNQYSTFKWNGLVTVITPTFLQNNPN